MKELKKVVYDENKCNHNYEAVCPYCGCDNQIESEDYKGQDEETIEECENCGKKFIHTIDYCITFTSEPYENWLIRQIESSKDEIKDYKRQADNTQDAWEKGYYQSVVEYQEIELEGFLKEVKILEVEE